MTARHSKQIVRTLKKNGFVVSEKHHHYYRYITLAGETVDIKTYVSHGVKDYGNQLLSDMAKQLKLTKQELLELIDGEMSREEYEGILKVKGII